MLFGYIDAHAGDGVPRVYRRGHGDILANTGVPQTGYRAPPRRWLIPLYMNVPFAVRERAQTWRALAMPASPTCFSVLVAALIAIGLALFNAALIVQTINLYH